MNYMSPVFVVPIPVIKPLQLLKLYCQLIQSIIFLIPATNSLDTVCTGLNLEKSTRRNYRPWSTNATSPTGCSCSFWERIYLNFFSRKSSIIWPVNFQMRHVRILSMLPSIHRICKRCESMRLTILF